MGCLPLFQPRVESSRQTGSNPQPAVASPVHALTSGASEEWATRSGERSARRTFLAHLVPRFVQAARVRLRYLTQSFPSSVSSSERSAAVEWFRVSHLHAVHHDTAP